MREKKKFPLPALFIAICLLAPSLRATEPETAGPDWAYYATIDSAGGKQDFFFLRSDIKTTPDGHIRVWAKGLPDSELARVKLTEDQLQRTFGRIIAKPSSLPGITDDQKSVVAAYEVLAAVGNIAPKTRVLWELDCPNEMLRTLSMYLTNGSKHQDSNVTGQWMHSPPESTMSTLMAMVCPAGK